MVLRFKSSFQQFSDPAGSGTHPRRRLIAPSTWCSMKGFRSGSSLPTPSNQSPWTPAELVGVVTILLDIGLGGALSLRSPGSSLWLKLPRLLKHGCASVGNWPPHTL